MSPPVKRLLAAAVLAVVAVAALPWGVARLAGAERGRWCAAGVCLEGVRRAGVTAARAELGWDASLHLADAHATLGRGSGEGGRPPPFTRVTVDRLHVDGTPLPPLSGELLPVRALTGDGVEVHGSTVTATLRTEHGTVEVRAEPDGDGLRVEARCRCTFAHPALGTLPDRDVVARGTWDGARFTGDVRVEAVTATIEATRADGGAVDARFTLDRVAVADVIDALAPIVPEARRARVEGTLSATGRVTWPDVTLEIDPALEGFTVDGLVSPDLARGPFTWPTRDAAGTRVLRTAGEGVAGWLPLAEAGALLPMAVVATEDAGFWSHPGYDLAGMREAAAANRDAGEVVRGGSTLTQQLAKNLFLDGERSYARKLRELLYAVELERELGKPRILELYLNVVEFGPGLYGARAAADQFFLKSPRALLPEEAAWMASILRMPRTAWERQYRAGRPDTARVRRILENMRELPDDVRAAAIARPLRLVPP